MLARSRALLALLLAIAGACGGLSVRVAAHRAYADSSLATAATAAVAAPAAGLPAVGSVGCSCADPSLCQPITAVHDREVFGFSLVRQAPYDRYDWSQVTTVAWNDDPLLVCAAHAAGARVVLNAAAATSPAVYGNRTARAAWLAEQLRYAQHHFLDGMNFDLEDPLPLGDPLAAEYAALVAEAAAAFHAAIPGSQVSVDVPWSPYGVDGRWYDWHGLAAAADLLVVMAYDMQSQIWGRCVASANSPAALVRRGVEEWLQSGVPAAKLVLGLPCDAAGSQLCFSDVRAALRRGSGGRSLLGALASASAVAGPATFEAAEAALDALAAAGQLPAAPARRGGSVRRQPKRRRLVCDASAVDAAQRSPFARCRLDSDPPGLARFQVWYDDPESLTGKYALAAELGLRGVGMWHLDCLDWATPEGREDAAAMWAALRAFTGPPRQALRADGGGGGAARLEAS